MQAQWLDKAEEARSLDVFECLAGRRSTRLFSGRSLEPEVIDQILEAARIAPSGGNVQPWRFVLVTSDSVRAELARTAYDQVFVAQAGLVVVCCGLLDAYDSALERCPDMVDPRLPALQGRRETQLKNAFANVAIAVEHMALAAHALGVASCWVRHFRDYEITQLLCLPDNLAVVALLCLGYASDLPAPRPRKSLGDIVIGTR